MEGKSGPDCQQSFKFQAFSPNEMIFSLFVCQPSAPGNGREGIWFSTGLHALKSLRICVGVKYMEDQHNEEVDISTGWFAIAAVNRL